ncbi:hypothetical protein FS935_22405 [Metabacillus litoralis]|uniref:Uncharacterized protein n=1 Tax=Metabacillus litoralis TaxID=152268 RepID=A0A5C6V566_9BACI|nr:hypothetical protein [Metabacillus litoralis]TXC78735.1 hypothetical protein FS935_22405 [Metabacillus litoralis]
MKSTKIRILLYVIIIVMIFIGGYYTGKITSTETTREITIGYENQEHPDQIDFTKIIKDSEDQSAVDNFTVIYSNNSKIIIEEDMGKPDVYLSIRSPKQFTNLIDSKIWFTKEGATIGIRSGETWKKIDYFSINKDDANYIREKIDFN